MYAVLRFTSWPSSRNFIWVRRSNGDRLSPKGRIVQSIRAHKISFSWMRNPFRTKPWAVIFHYQKFPFRTCFSASVNSLKLRTHETRTTEFRLTLHWGSTAEDGQSVHKFHQLAVYWLSSCGYHHGLHFVKVPLLELICQCADCRDRHLAKPRIMSIKAPTGFSRISSAFCNQSNNLDQSVHRVLLHFA